MAEIEIRQNALADLDRQAHACQACPLGAQRTHAVPGEGPVGAEIVFIGEAPGYYEDQQGRPFIGAAGHFLEQLLASIELKRTDVFIANIVKCRPPGNRDPSPEEISTCSQWLTSQLEILRPKLVVTLGRYSLARFLPGTPIGKIHGEIRTVGELSVVPMYHPAAALHQGGLRRTIEDDFRRIPAYLQAAIETTAARQRPEDDAPVEPEPAQMKLL